MATMKNRAIEETKKRRSKRLNIRFALVALRATRIPTAAGHPPGNRQPALDALAPLSVFECRAEFGGSDDHRREDEDREDRAARGLKAAGVLVGSERRDEKAGPSEITSMTITRLGVGRVVLASAIANPARPPATACVQNRRR
jgi:hypothetical protein